MADRRRRVVDRSRRRDTASGMTRRELIAAVVALLGTRTVSTRAADETSRLRPRLRPGDLRWPTPGAWADLSQRVGGQLIQPEPLLAPCRTAADDTACVERRRLLRNPYFLGDQPAGTQVSGWFDAWAPAPSAYAVAARNAADVAAAVNFARDHDLRLVVKGGGHSYQGTSTAPDSLLVWTRHMRDITLHDTFMPAGCERTVAPGPAVSIGAGALWMDVFDAVTTRAGRYVQGGGCATVGVAGLIQSGGFGSFSKRFGIAAAGLLEAEIVTADGVVRTVNACHDPDLFWALKGGGGGTFGVVTRVTLRTHDLPMFFGGANARIRATSDESFARLIERFIAVYATALFNPHWGESVTIRPDNRLEIAMVHQGLDGHAAEAIWQPFFAWITSRPADYVYDDPPSISAGPARGWWDAQSRRARGSTSVVFDDRPDAEPTHAWWSGDQEQVSAFLHGYESLWLTESLLRGGDRRASLASALVAASRHTAVQLHFNKGLAGAPPDVIRAARDTAMHPDVMTAFALAIMATGGAPPFTELEVIS